MRCEDGVTLLVKLEGGFTVDDGGPTKWGITQAQFDDWCRLGGFDHETVENLEWETAIRFYDDQWWTRFHIYLLPDKLDFIVFQAIVDCGPHAIRWLQGVVGVFADEVIGPKTAKACEAFKLPFLVQKFLELQEADYLRLEEANPEKYKNYADGWSRRLHKAASVVGFNFIDKRPEG